MLRNYLVLYRGGGDLSRFYGVLVRDAESAKDAATKYLARPKLSDAGCSNLRDNVRPGAIMTGTLIVVNAVGDASEAEVAFFDVAEVPPTKPTFVVTEAELVNVTIT